MRVRSAFLTIALLAGLATTAHAGPALTPCGTTTLYGQTLRLRVVAHRTTCANVRRLARRPSCELPDRLRGAWVCLSSPGRGPALYWFRGDDAFKRGDHVAAVALRPPCRDARVTRAAWRRASRQRGDRLPTHRQLLADDLVRCRQLVGLRERALLRLLGAPSESGGGEDDWELGPERSLFSLDSDYLSVTVRSGRVRRATVSS